MDEQHTDIIEHSVEDGKEPMRRRLGRGLNALLSGATADEMPKPRDLIGPGPDASEICVELIEPNPYQPRRDFDDEQLAELVESIKEHGVLQPILVRPHNGAYQLIAGERRLIAAKRVGFENVPCRVLEFEDQQVFEAALVENLQRKDLGVLEKAQAFQDYLDRFGSSVEQLAKQLGLNRSTVTNFIRLLGLPNPVKKALAAEKISNGHARALLKLSEERQIDLCKRIQKEAMSVRQTEQAVRELKTDDDEPQTIPFETAKDSADQQSLMTQHLLQIQDQLRDRLGAPVEIKLKTKDSGKIVITFDSNEQFEHIVGQLRHAA